MKNGLQKRPLGCALLFTLALVITLPLSTAAEPPANMQGWEIDSAYNQLYDAREMDSFKGYVRKIYTLVPMPGMAPATALLVAESEEDLNVVHVCPEWFAGPGDIGVRRGDRVKVKGVWAEIDGEFVFMASKVKKGDYFEFKVRITKDGTPFWTLTPEEQEKHSN